GERARRRIARSRRRILGARQPGEGRGGFGAPELQRALRLSRDDGPRSAPALAMSYDVLGFTAGAGAAGVKDGTPSRLDVALIVSDRPCAAAGVFTTNQVIPASCIITRSHPQR